VQPKQTLRFRHPLNATGSMRLGSSLFPGLLTRRNEISDIYYQIGQAFLYTGIEPAGEGNRI
jgi:hypothetical protein